MRVSSASARGFGGGFTLLEVMVALALMVASLAILVEIQGSSAHATMEAERIVVATQLAEEMLTEVSILVEKEGISQEEMTEQGDFSDFGSDEMDLEFGENLEDYHYEWWVSQIDLGLAGDIATMAQSLEGTGLLPGQGDEDGASSLQDQAPDLNTLGISNDMITEMLGRYIREIRIRVWWGEDSDDAEEHGDEVILTSHATDPAGSFVNLSQGQVTQ